jgi:DNA-binding HxlR family transcriptional regulator
MKVKKGSKSSPASKHERCPVTEVAELLSDSWTMLIIHHLMMAPSQTLRFCDFDRKLEGISTRTLAAKLKYLCEQGIVEKGDAGYVMTALGKKLEPVIREMERFGGLLP